MRAKLATPGGLVAAAVLFVIVYALTGSLIWSSVVALVGSLGVYLMLDGRTIQQVAADTYADDAEQKAGEVAQTVRQLRRLSREIRSPAARSSLESACQYVPELLDRVRTSSPDSLYSSAAQIGAHLTSLHGVVRQYLDIQAKPALYPKPDALLRSGEEAFQRFAEFAFDSLQLVNQGDLAEYRANLETVAPPRLPELS
jgi:hypothetical protein